MEELERMQTPAPPSALGDRSFSPAASASQLTDMRFLRETPRFVMSEGFWAERRTPCVSKTALNRARAAADRASLRPEAGILALLERVPGVPKLLHLDIAAITLVDTRAPG